MYTKYEKVLLEKYDIDFQGYVNTIRSFGNESGIYADVALLLFELASDSNTSGVLEFGSGISTLVLAKACEIHSISLLTCEHAPKWFSITRNCLDFYNLNEIHFVCTNNSSFYFPELDILPSLVWVDGALVVPGEGDYSGRVGACEYYWERIRDAFLLFDDAQWDIFKYEEFLSRMGRDTSLNYMFNPTGRLDRHVLISPPYKNHPYVNTIKEKVLSI